MAVRWPQGPGGHAPRGLASAKTGDFSFATSGEFYPASDTPLPFVALNGLTLGFQCPEPIDPAVAAAFASSVERLRAAGVRLVAIDITEAQAIDNACGFPIAVYESALSMSELAVTKLGISWPSFVDAIESPDVQAVFASQLGNEAIPEAAYRDAVDVQLPRLRAAFDRVFIGVDAILYPTTAHTAPRIGDTGMTDLGGALLPTFPAYTLTSRPDSMAGLPSISLPAGLANGLPFGLQVAGRPGADRHLLGIASALEAILPARPVPPL
ncbi:MULTISPECIES: amidase family protein [unclassified Azospirillum]|uniref:amidase family protein n=1 Tax=unclassified Azospirillum TaxID=2630922 RepID=UPI000B7506FB|nr:MULTISPECIES: amidase family protein [unclassified Azospirillum]SNT23687.1 Amidase [Azospirillum sp. RU38E]SNT34778.1 Amidase [Azospirillum sp. RU37A]